MAPEHHHQLPRPPEDWQKIFGATPVAPIVVDNRSEEEKAASARRTNAEAQEHEQKNWRVRLNIGWSYAWRFGLTFIAGFLAGNLFHLSFWG